MAVKIQLYYCLGGGIGEPHNQIPGRASLPCRLCGTASHPAGHGYYSAESSVRLGQGAKSPNPG